MTLYELVRHIERVASSQPPINMIIENDIDKLNAIADAKYGVFSFVQGQHRSSVNSDFITYSFTFYYVDRLTEDDSNMVEIQSVGVQTLDNILRVLSESDEYIGVGDYSFQPFLHSFADKCAGVYATVSIQVLRDSKCAENYIYIHYDFNEDYNSDFFSEEFAKWNITKKVI